MKQNQITLIIIGFILVALMATNPSTEEHKEAIKKEIFKAIESDNNSNSAHQLGEKFGESIGGAIIDKMVQRQNYVLFSMATVKIVKMEGVTNNAITLGIFGQIILLKRYDKESKEFVDNTGFSSAETIVKTDSAAPVTSTVENNKSSNQKIPDYISAEDDATNRDGDIVGLNDIIGKPIKIGNLEVAKIDFPKKMIWEDAKKACENLGSGWRLPTKDELKTLYLSKDKIGGFAKDFYWSSTEVGNDNAWGQDFPYGTQVNASKSTPSYVRAIRAF
jgi:hypothetical protein